MLNHVKFNGISWTVFLRLSGNLTNHGIIEYNMSYLRWNMITMSIILKPNPPEVNP
jgi:hypothetical protein